jgi:hypothetical protein
VTPSKRADRRLTSRLPTVRILVLPHDPTLCVVEGDHLHDFDQVRQRRALNEVDFIALRLESLLPLGYSRHF